MMNMDYDDSTDSSDSGDEDLGLLRRALHVEMALDFDPNKIPESGEEYLQHVMYEAHHCPEFVVAPIDTKKIRPPSMQIEVGEGCSKAPASMLPTQQWQEETITDFIQLRKFISREVGKFNRNPDGYFYVNRGNNIKELLATEFPRFSTIVALSQENKVKALEAILEQLEKVKMGESIDRRRGIWIYGLLANLDLPLEPNICHFLRDLARKCSQIRSCLPDTSTEEHYVPLNLIICVIAKFYRQLDLADE